MACDAACARGLAKKILMRELEDERFQAFIAGESLAPRPLPAQARGNILALQRVRSLAGAGPCAQPASISPERSNEGARRAPALEERAAARTPLPRKPASTVPRHFAPR
jgi:hypothetical protein